MTTDTVNLPPLHGNDDPEKDLLWHALNYRGAGTMEAQAMWEELEKFVRSYALLAVQEERAEKEAMKVAWATQLQAAGVLESQANTIVEDTCSRIASAIRSQQP